MLGGLWFGNLISPGAAGAISGFGVGFVLAWLWWSLAVPRWRRWALGRGVDPDELQNLAQKVGLVWRRGSFFEKTELPPREEK